jgi:haloalkane dehalogenase
MIVRTFNAFAWPATFMTTDKPLSDKVKKGYLLPYDNYHNRVAVANFVKDIPLGPEHPSYETLLEVEHGLWLFRETPISLIWGMNDWCFNNQFLDKWMTYYPQAEVHRLEAGHYVLEDAYDTVLEYIKQFFEKKPIK